MLQELFRNSGPACRHARDHSGAQRLAAWQPVIVRVLTMLGSFIKALHW